MDNLACSGATAVGDYDTRFKRLAVNPRFVVINNGKCGFSSSNMLHSEPAASISGDDETVFFYRDIVSRAISVFIMSST
jgi:hypothetical protein